MPWITTVVAYDAVLAKVDRLDLLGVLDEVGRILTEFDLRVHEERDANGGAAVRKMLDARFDNADWLCEERGQG